MGTQSIELFCIKNDMSGMIVTDSVYLDMDKARAEICYNENVTGRYNYNSIDTINVDFASEYINFVEVYHGFDYSFGAGSSSIHDVIERSDLYPSIELAKKSDLWLKYEQIANLSPDKYIFSDTIIASNEFGDEFMYGDVIAGKFNMSITQLKVIK